MRQYRDIVGVSEKGAGLRTNDPNADNKMESTWITPSITSEVDDGDNPYGIGHSSSDRFARYAVLVPIASF